MTMNCAVLDCKRLAGYFEKLNLNGLKFVIPYCAYHALEVRNKRNRWAEEIEVNNFEGLCFQQFCSKPIEIKKTIEFEGKKLNLGVCKEHEI